MGPSGHLNIADINFVMHGPAGLNLEGKPVAVYGLGDSVGYGDYFCDAMEEIYRCDVQTRLSLETCIAFGRCPCP